MKRITVTLPAKLVENLIVVTQAKSKSQAVAMAVEEEIKRKKWRKIKEMAGKLEFSREAGQLRHVDHRAG